MPSTLLHHLQIGQIAFCLPWHDALPQLIVWWIIVVMRPIHFIGETIAVQFDEPPLFSKKPGCPDGFVWNERTYLVVELLSEWHDYRRRGRMATNMQPEHAAAAEQRGSWGVGRTYFRVRTDSGQIFDLYYDRAPGKAGDRKGAWFLYREMDELA